MSAKPDQAVVEIGVVSQGATVAAAAAQNAKQTDTVLAGLTSLLKGNNNIRTTSYSVRPNYTSPKPGTAPSITGYTATNLVEVTLDDLGQVGIVIDAATQSGANVVQRLQYQFKNPETLRNQVLRQAAERARASAEAIASGLGLKVVGVLSAEEVAPEEGVVMYKRALPSPPPTGAAPATPLEIGTIDIEARILLRLEVRQ